MFYSLNGSTDELINTWLQCSPFCPGTSGGQNLAAGREMTTVRKNLNGLRSSFLKDVGATVPSGVLFSLKGS